MFENIRYHPELNVVMNRSNEDIRYYFDWSAIDLHPRVNIKDIEGWWWEPETVERDNNIKIY